MTLTIINYTTNKAIGEITMSDDQREAYVRDAQWPEGLIAYNELRGEKVMSEADFDPSITVWLEE